MLFDRVNRGKVHMGVTFFRFYIVFIRCISVPNRVHVVKLMVLSIMVSLINKLRSVVTSTTCIASRCNRAAFAREAASLVLVVVAGTSGILVSWWNTTRLVQCLQVLLHSELFIVGHRRPNTVLALASLASKRVPVVRLTHNAPTCYQLVLLMINGRGRAKDRPCTLKHSRYVRLLCPCCRYKHSLSLCWTHWTQHSCVSSISVLTLVNFTRFDHRSMLNIRELQLDG